MAANESLARRVRLALAHVRGVEEKLMFGGVAFMVDGRMCVTVGRDGIMCRIGPDAHDTAIANIGCQSVVMRGHTIRGYVRITSSAVRSKTALARWVRLAIAHNRQLR